MTPLGGPPRTALVTGGAGFIGHHLVSALLDDGWSVTVLDDLSSGRADRIPDSVRFVEGSIFEPNALRTAIQGVRVVYHLAAQVSVLSSVEDPARNERINVGGVRRVLAAAEQAGVRSVVFASTCAVYGEPSELPLTERADLAPRSPYATSKQKGEQLGYAWATAGRFFAALRMFNVYGPGQKTGGAYGAVIASFVRAARTGACPVIFGDGLQTRDFVHVEDVVRAFVAVVGLMERRGTCGPYNVGTGQAVSLLGLWEIISAEYGSDASPELAPTRPGDIVHSVADASAIKRELAWSATMPLAAGLRSMRTSKETEPT